MHSINRQQKLEHLAAQPELSTNYYFDEQFVPDYDLTSTTARYYDDIRREKLTGPFDHPLNSFNFWLAATKSGRELLAQDAPLTTTLEAYAEAIDEEQHTIESYMPHFQQMIQKRLSALAKSGDIPEVLAERYKAKNGSHISIGIMDSLHLKDGAGIYDTDTHTIYVRPFFKPDRLAKLVVHESFHGLSGLSMKRDGSELISSRLGLSTDLAREKGSGPNVAHHRAINEGVTEYLTNLLIFGNPGKVSFEERFKAPRLKGHIPDTGTYTEEREIIQILADRIGLDVILNAYVEDYDPTQPDTTQHMRTFIGKVRKTYGPGFLRQLDKIDREQGVEAAVKFMKAADKEVSRPTSENKRHNRAKKIHSALTYVGLK